MQLRAPPPTAFTTSRGGRGELPLAALAPGLLQRRPHFVGGRPRVAEARPAGARAPLSASLPLALVRQYS
eukprot:2973193-Alexandrium_andersonii.AAC.1